MGWTLFACFGGCSNERKRPRSSRLGLKSKRIQAYQQLQSDVLKEFDEEHRDKPNDEKKARIRKKVRFNLDVIVYEPISDYDTSNLQQDPDENVSDEQAACLVYAHKRAKQSLPADYRYNNCYGDEDYDDGDGDEDEDSEFEFSDLENEDEDYSSKPLISDKGMRTSTDEQNDALHRRHYVIPVLNPVENLSQWKAIKARKC
ncbi:uncharacterized protein LOC141657099 [Silene latifolia]|uniref:uncharacterized protein LOC141657099 n=1 Tax=Silene latifolia TaxID=37657 RepID=UPI003D781355